MQFKNVGDGAIVIPVSQTAEKREPEPPSREYGPLEIRGEKRRIMAEKALGLLWEAMGLSYDNDLGGIQLHCAVTSSAHRQLHAYIGEMLLGEDCPEQETLT